MSKVRILDHGSIELVESWGSEERIVEAARMSTGGTFRGWEKDEKLLRYLWEHKHTSPFEMAGAVFEVKAPIFVFREWHRHRTQSYNEMSARYVELPNESYIPTLVRCGVTEENARAWISQVECAYNTLQEVYQIGLEASIPRELARIVLPVGRYSRMRTSANLLNWFRFLTLRTAENAQYEIREYARAASNLIAEKFPRVHALWKENKI